MDVIKIKHAFQKVAGPQDTMILSRLFESLSAVDSGSGPLLDYKTGDGKATLRKDHPVAALYNRSKAEGKVYFLLSALVSVFNRGEAMYEDKHERDFHARLIHYLLQTT